MTVSFYTIAFVEDPDEPGWFDIEHMYCFDWDRFSETDWQSLHGIYLSLPEYCATTQKDYPRWFASYDDCENGFLTASVEPPGLHVFGSLPYPKWTSWNQQLLQMTNTLPCRIL